MVSNVISVILSFCSNELVCGFNMFAFLPRSQDSKSFCNVNFHPVICMLSHFGFRILFLAFLKLDTPELALGIEEIQRKLIVGKISDITLLTKFKFSEWDQDGKV